MFAPNINQLHVIDHTKGEEDKNPRNVLVESARIARGNISSLDKLVNFNHKTTVGWKGGRKVLHKSNFSEWKIKPDVIYS